MPSESYNIWTTTRLPLITKLDDAHKAVRRNHVGRPHGVQYLNHAFTIAIASHFQAFCRDLHSECVDHLRGFVESSGVGQATIDVIFFSILLSRKLDSKNATSSSLGSDFGRFGFNFIPALKAQSKLNKQRLSHLDEMNAWRNAIAHQNFNNKKVDVSGYLTLSKVRTWHNACDKLTLSMDNLMKERLRSLTESDPWS